MSRRLCSLVLGTSILVSAAVRAQNPPFNQAPPIGLDSSAAILLVIDPDGSLRVRTDSSQPPYDGIEDTLFGVQNNSTQSIGAIPLTGMQPIFGFDGDGICAVSPHPAACPFGSTGYEGPGVSFTDISPDRKFGIVRFNPPIPPGGSAYFGLEEAIQTLCPPITAPQHLLQGDPMWASAHLGSSMQTIGSFGCYITSGAMLINYHAAHQGSVFRTDPLALSQWLFAHGYLDNMGFVFPRGEPFAEYARANGVTLYYGGPIDKRDDFTLDQYLCQGEPPTLYVGHPGSPHWVFATGQTIVGGADTYSVFDPDSYPNGNTLQGFGFTYGAMDLYLGFFGPPRSGLYIVAHSPVDLLLTAPSGEKTGFDTATQTSLDAIPRSGYIELSLANDQDHSLPNLPPEKYLSVFHPSAGTYSLEVTGTANGHYVLDFAAFDSAGNQSRASFSGMAVLGSHVVYQVVYSDQPGVPLVVLPPPDTTPPSIMVASNPAIMWPPNHTMRPVTVSGSITDLESGVARGATYSVVDEYGEYQPAGAVLLDSKGEFSFVIWLEAARHGNDQDGRLYTITISASDRAGNVGIGVATVVVPHNM